MRNAKKPEADDVPGSTVPNVRTRSGGYMTGENHRRRTVGVALGLLLATLCVAPALWAEPGEPSETQAKHSPKEGAAQARDERKPTTRVESMTVGADGAQATYRGLESTCSPFRLTIALTASAPEVSACLEEADARRIAVQMENGKVVAAKAAPNDEKARCLVAALGAGKFQGLTCVLSAEISR